MHVFVQKKGINTGESIHKFFDIGVVVNLNHIKLNIKWKSLYNLLCISVVKCIQDTIGSIKAYLGVGNRKSCS